MSVITGLTDTQRLAAYLAEKLRTIVGDPNPIVAIEKFGQETTVRFDDKYYNADKISAFTQAVRTLLSEDSFPGREPSCQFIGFAEQKPGDTHTTLRFSIDNVTIAKAMAERNDSEIYARAQAALEAKSPS